MIALTHLYAIPLSHSWRMHKHPAQLSHSSSGDDTPPDAARFCSLSSSLSPIINHELTASTTSHQPSFPADHLPSIPWDRLRSATNDDDDVVGPLMARATSAYLLQKKDLDAIDRLDDDCVDAAMANGKGGKGVPDKGKGKAAKEVKCDEKTVTCLYYTLQCCECSIS